MCYQSGVQPNTQAELPNGTGPAQEIKRVRRWFYGTLGVLIAAPAWMIGAVHIQSQLALTALALLVLLSLLFWNWSLPSKARRKLGVDAFAFFFGAFLLLTLLQWLPWPQGLLKWASPESFKLWKQALASVHLDHATRWLPYTPAPGDTAVKLVRDLGVVVVYFTVFQWVRQRWHLTLLLQISVVSACALSLLVLLQTMLGKPYPLWGMYIPAILPDGLLKGAPLINSNHLGGYLVFHTFLAYTLLNDSHKEWQQYIWGGASFLLSGMVLLTLSRGSIVVFGVGFVLFFLLMELLHHRDKERVRLLRLEAAMNEEEEDEDSRKEGPRRRRTPLFARLWRKPSTRYFLMVGALAVSLGFYFASDALKKEFSSTKLSLKQDKFQFIREASGPLLKHYPLFGVGRGAQAMVWSRHSNRTGAQHSQLTVSHVESLLLQPLVDWGLGFGVLFLLVGGFLFLRLGWVLDHPLEAGTWLALFLLLVQNLGDFNLEFAATAFPAVAVLAALSRLQLERSSRMFRLPTVIPVVSGVLGVVLLAWWGSYAWKHDYHRLKPVWKQLSKTPLDQLPKKTAYWMQHHPSDYILPLVVAQRFVSVNKGWKPQQGLLWLERAEFLNPTAPDLFLLRGYIYARLGLDREASRAMGRAVELRPRYLRSALRLLRRYKQLRAAIRYSTSSRLVSSSLEEWLRGRPVTDATRELAEKTLKRFPRSLEVYRVVGNQYINSLASKKKWSRQERLQWEQKIEKLLKLMRRRFVSLQGYDLLMKARLLELRGQRRQTLKLYQELFERDTPHRWSAFQYMVPLLMAEGEHSRLGMVFQVSRQRFRGLWQRAQIAYLEGRWHETQKRFRKALESYNEAIQIRSLPEYSLARARVCLELSMFQCTLRIYKFLSRKKQYGYLKQRIEKVRQRMNRSRSGHPLHTP
jgi:tetratricopeptide (TPR) repeat protein/MFS family permease